MNVSRKQAIKVGLGAVLAAAFGAKKTVDSVAQTNGGGQSCHWVCRCGRIGYNAQRYCYSSASGGYVSVGYGYSSFCTSYCG
jgi:hypothetical protein